MPVCIGPSSAECARLRDLIGHRHPAAWTPAGQRKTAKFSSQRVKSVAGPRPKPSEGRLAGAARYIPRPFRTTPLFTVFGNVTVVYVVQPSLSSLPVATAMLSSKTTRASLLGPAVERRQSVDLLWRQHGPVTDSSSGTPALTPHSHAIAMPQAGDSRVSVGSSGAESSCVSRVGPMPASLAKKLNRLGKLRKYQDRRGSCVRNNHGPITFRSLAREVNPLSASASTIMSVGSDVSSDGDLEATSYGRVFAPNQPGPLGAGRESMSRRGSRERRGSNSGISRDINKRLRHTVLNQHKLTNRFTGNDAAKRVEQACTPQLHTSGPLTRTPDQQASTKAVLYCTHLFGPCLADLAFVTRYQLPYVRRRLVLFAMMLLFCAQAEGVLTNSFWVTAGSSYSASSYPPRL